MSSHHLVTVCICLLCATHSSCSAHDGLAYEPDGLTEYRDLRHERFKEGQPAPGKEYSNVIYQTPDIVYDQSVYNKLKDVNYDRDYHAERINNAAFRGHKRLRTNVDDFNNRAKSRIDKIERNIVQDQVDRDISQRIEDIERRVGVNPHVERSVMDSLGLSHSLGSDGLAGSRPFAGDRDSFKYDVGTDYSRHHAKAAHVADGEDSNFKRRRRDTHASPDADANSSKSDTSNATRCNLKDCMLKNIDVDFYIKKLFVRFGDRENMMMDLKGFEQMLKELGLDRMVLDHTRQPPIEIVVNGERSNSSNVMCATSVDLLTSLARSYQPHDHQHDDGHDHSASNKSVDALRSDLMLNSRLLTRLCPILLYQKVAPTSYEREGCVVAREYPKISGERKLDSAYKNYDDEDIVEAPPQNRTAVWAYSSLCILAISACGLLGVAVIPIMHHQYYQQILQFLVALAVGTLCGDALLHLLPHALSTEGHGHGGEHSHNDSMWKGLVAMLGVVFFYFTEKCLMLITEWRKRRMRSDNEKKIPSRVRVMRNDIGCLKGSGSCSSRNGKDGFIKIPGLNFKPGTNNKNDEANSQIAVPGSGKICKHKYSEYPYCYDEIATETLDDHHVAKSQKKTEERLSVVSSNALRDQDNCEADVNDSLLSGDSKSRAVCARVAAALHGDADGDGAAVEKVHEANGKKRSSGIIMDRHVRSRSADRATDYLELNKLYKPEEYTVILREHSQTHHGHSHSHGHVHSPPSSLSSVVWMVIMGDGLHNFTDGMAIGAAFSSNIAGGFSTAIAVLCHELPHEIGDFAVLLKAGMSARRAVFYNLLSSILCLFGMVVGVAAGHTPEATAWIFAAAAGMFIYIALVDMIPELSSSHSKEGSFCQCLLQLLGLACGIGVMLLIAIYEHDLKRLFG